MYRVEKFHYLSKQINSGLKIKVSVFVYFESGKFRVNFLKELTGHILLNYSSSINNILSNLLIILSQNLLISYKHIIISCHLIFFDTKLNFRFLQSKY